MGKFESSPLTSDEIWALFDPGTPFTAAEVAEAADRSRAAAREELDDLVDAGALESKRTGDARVWWQPPGVLDDLRGERRGLTHAQFEELVDTVTEYAIFVLDAGGRVRSWNAGAEHVKGYAETEILGEHVSTFYTDEAVADGVPERNLQTAAETGQAKDEGWRVRNDGSQFWANVVITALRDDGGLRGFVKVTRDMTERHEYEEQLRTRNERLQQQNQRLESFASMLAHELRNPLTIAQIYLEQAVEGDPDAAAEVTTALDRIEEMVDVLLIIARGADSVTDRESVAVADAAQEAWVNVTPDDAELVVETDRVIQADPVHLQHLFENLFRNAVEHGSTGNQPQADTAVERGDAGVTVRIGDVPKGFYVADDGPGIPESEREQVFDAGYTSDADGIGLGLTFVTQLADTYGWEVAVAESDVGGARFEFTGVERGADVEGGRRD